MPTIPAYEFVKTSGIGWIRATGFSLAPLAGRGLGEGLFTLYQRPHCSKHPCPSPGMHAQARIPTSPRKRGEVVGRAANSFTNYYIGMTMKRDRSSVGGPLFWVEPSSRIYSKTVKGIGRYSHIKVTYKARRPCRHDGAGIAQCDVVIKAVVDRIPVKEDVFRTLDEVRCRPRHRL